MGRPQHEEEGEEIEGRGEGAREGQMVMQNTGGRTRERAYERENNRYTQVCNNQREEVGAGERGSFLLVFR